jgi:integrase
MKGKREHRVPLVGRAIEILRAMEPYRDGEYVFPGRGRNKGLSNMALLKTLERMKRDDVTVHGFRSTFRDWASERTTFAREVIEMALAHAIGDKVEAAYRRGDLFDKRRKLMEAWRSFLARPASSSVVPIGARRIEVARAAGLGARARSPA